MLSTNSNSSIHYVITSFTISELRISQLATPVTECLESSTPETQIVDLPKCRPHYPPHLYRISRFQESQNNISISYSPKWWNVEFWHVSQCWPHSGTFCLFGISDSTISRILMLRFQISKPQTCEMVTEFDFRLLTSTPPVHSITLYLWTWILLPPQTSEPRNKSSQIIQWPSLAWVYGPISPELILWKTITITPLTPLQDLTALATSQLPLREFRPVDSSFENFYEWTNVLS